MPEMMIVLANRGFDRGEIHPSLGVGRERVREDATDRGHGRAGPQDGQRCLS